MNEVGGGRSSSPWNFCPSSDASAMSPPQNRRCIQRRNQLEEFRISFHECHFIWVWRYHILEHLFRPNLSSSSQDGFDDGRLESGSAAKLRNQNVVMTPTASGFSVVMPGRKYPICIAEPAPLIPFPREGIRCPPQQHMFPFCQINYNIFHVRSSSSPKSIMTFSTSIFPFPQIHYDIFDVW
ncbi:hypothetical protein Cgig2_006774 [Carnegiea gigantea]|uniref:Uncharacterized protein n=1 Tax=Carnegiea gigantea TaxID=171969 RepID=A0A9Q1JRU6_9CARY|nr:hypothetical protein Cgig2_006774 [Carnegiea gigantea]